MLLHMSHNFADAEPLYKQSIAIKTKVLGANHPDVMRLLEGYADLLLKTHREAEARHLQVCAQGACRPASGIGPRWKCPPCAPTER